METWGRIGSCSVAQRAAGTLTASVVSARLLAEQRDGPQRPPLHPVHLKAVPTGSRRFALDDRRRAVGDDSAHCLADLGRIEPHHQHRVGAHRGRISHEPVDRVARASSSSWVYSSISPPTIERSPAMMCRRAHDCAPRPQNIDP